MRPQDEETEVTLHCPRSELRKAAAFPRAHSVLAVVFPKPLLSARRPSPSAAGTIFELVLPVAADFEPLLNKQYASLYDNI